MDGDDLAGRSPIAWAPEAEARLLKVPEGIMRELTRQRVERLAVQLGRDTVTVDLMEAKYRQWADGSARATGEMRWTDEARERIDRVPPFVRGMVVEAIEAYAARHGLAEITPGTVDEAKGSWGDTGQFHGP